MEERNLCQGGDSSMTASAVGPMELNRPKFKTSTTVVLGMTQRERRKHVSFFYFWSHNITQREGHCFAVVLLQRF